MKVIVWGTGYIANEYMERKYYHINDDIIAFVDNNKELWGKKYRNIEIIPPDALEGFEFDKLVICTTHYKEIKSQIEKEIHISSGKIMTFFDLEEDIKNELIAKYSRSPDKDIQKVLKYYASNPLNIFGFYEGDDDMVYPVLYDTDGMPYILFEGKKMFFPKTYKFAESGNAVSRRVWIKNILYEQGKHSPHRYIKSEDIIKNNMVIVDAGVCEGNFALRYVENAKKMYLIESDPEWVEALKRTFQPYEDKVIICNKCLAGEDTGNTITLDTLINEKIDLLKMDIEGYETDALKGGKRVLEGSNAYCAICSYHKHGDEQKIKKLLQNYGYKTDTSEGYMFFPYDGCLEFRRGVVYGIKNNI